ncbi:transcriptional regulator, AraC family [Ktedonobacter racemifer DSM 44963]|uniref:Transcriptional regulator, AraC family n=2 Tax=Ktedonobacter racemifer TaxID=363277 RepID=D6TER9_KTERA|nr:transcriptional regulator, AraC family [Ktedonobacter racemifer DSM 44963]
MTMEHPLLWPTKANVGTIHYPSGSHFGPRYQPCLQLVFLHTGRMTVWIDNVAHQAEANTVFLLFPGHQERFAFAESEETHHSWLHLDVPELSPELHTRLLALPRPLPLTPLMQQLIHTALTLQPTRLSTTSELLQSLGTQMLWLYVGEGELHMQHKVAPTYATIEQARAYIQDHLHEPLTLEQIAQAVSISPSYLIRLFQAQLHTTPMAYLWQFRVIHGISLLQQTGLSVQAIADQCGFQTRHHFSRRVRQELGYGPQEVRHRSWLRS